MRIGTRKFLAFVLSLGAYMILFLVTLASGCVGKDEIAGFAFQLGMGISGIAGVFHAGNVLAKKYQGKE